MKKIDYLILIFVIIVALALRLYKIDIPLADFHSWRQADTAAVARNFVRGGFDLLHPRYDDFSNVQSGLENPQGYRYVEFPIYNAIFAALYKLIPSISLEIWGRITSIFFSLVVIAIIYYLTLKEFNRLAAVFASFIYAVFPFFVFFSGVILPETTALAFSFISILLLYLNPSFWLFYLLSIVFMATALLAKPPAIFFFLSILYIFWLKYRWSLIKKPQVYAYFILSALPLALWRIYMLKYPEGIPAAEWLLTSVNTGSGLQEIFLRPAFFRWVFQERINNIIMGGLATAFLVVGGFVKQKKLLLHSILASSVIYLFVFEGGNVQHVYYQTFILPAVAIFAGIGVSFVILIKRSFLATIISTLTVFVILAFSWFVSYYTVKDYYGYSTDLVQEAKIINSLTSPGDLVVTDTTGDTTLLYLSDRKGAPSVYEDPLVLAQKGYAYIATSNSGMVAQLKKDKFTNIFENDKLSIFKL